MSEPTPAGPLPTDIDRPIPPLVTGSGRLARGLFIVFCIEFGLYIWAACSNIESGMPWPQAVLRVFLIWFGIRTVAVGYNFALTWMNRSPKPAEQQLDLAATLRLFWGELYATLIVYSFLFPFEKFLVSIRPRKTAPHSGPPIILVPGFMCNRGYFVFFRRYLRHRGFANNWAVSLEPLLGNIEDSALQLRQWVETVCAETGADKVVLIGHSMGGLTIRSYLHQFGGEQRIAKALSLGSPHHGTVVAHGVAGLGEAPKQMSIGSPWTAALNQSEASASPVPQVAITTPHDNIVAPQDSSKLAEPYARNVILPGTGHLEMIVSREVMATVIDELNRLVRDGD